MKVKDDILTIYQEIVRRLSNAVKKRIQSDRPIGCLLSGGLDSSLVACLLAKHMVSIDKSKTLTFFSIGNSDAPDVVNAIKVFEHIKTYINPNVKHEIFDISFEEALNIIPDVIKAIETYDITTIRASTWQYLLAKKISETSDIKVILNGDGADEVEMGYQYFKKAPNAIEAQKESEKLVRDIHLYDCLRVDRAISYHGLEARVPFLDIEFFDYYMRISPELKVPIDGMEKHLIRRAFEVVEPNLLCKDVLWRRKEAFSDGVSKHVKSWFEIIQDKVDELVSNQEYLENKDKYKGVQPVSKESYYFRKIYESNYKNREDVIKYYWLPNWVGDIKEPSARVLKVYEN
jgi:asparagine synthase (glutamine-hydrolysing)